MTSSQTPYSSLAIKEETRWKFDKWAEHLAAKWGYTPTHDQTLDYLLDSVGPPPDPETIPEEATGEGLG